MALEMGRLRDSLVRERRHLADLLLEAEPTAPTPGGVHRFDPAAIRALADALSPLTRARLRLPLLVYLDHESRGSAYVSEAVVADALRELGYAKGELRDGRLWIGEALAAEAARRFPTCVQFVLL